MKFDVDGTIFVAHFSVETIGRNKRTRRITKCALHVGVCDGQPCSRTGVEGIARHNPIDKYSSHAGHALALTRALQGTVLLRPTRTAIWEQFHRYVKIRSSRVTLPSARRIAQIIDEELATLYPSNPSGKVTDLFNEHVLMHLAHAIRR